MLGVKGISSVGAFSTGLGTLSGDAQEMRGI